MHLSCPVSLVYPVIFILFFFCFFFKNGQLGKRPFRLRDLPNYVLMELWMIWNMVPYLWYRLVVVRFDLK